MEAIARNNRFEVAATDLKQAEILGDTASLGNDLHTTADFRWKDV